MALDAAARTQQVERHRLLAGIVAAGLRDANADVDLLLLLEQTAESLTDPHIRLLLLIEANPQELIEDTPGGMAGVTDRHLEELWPEARGVIVPLRLALEREGLIRDLGAGTYDLVQRWMLDLSRSRDYPDVIDPAKRAEWKWPGDLRSNIGIIAAWS